MIKNFPLLAAVLVFNSIVAQQSSTVQFVGGQLDVPHEIKFEAFNSVSKVNPFHGIVVVSTLPNLEQKIGLKESGLSIEDYIGNNSYYVSITAPISQEFCTKNNIVAISAIDPTVKLDPSIANQNHLPEHILAGENVRINAVLFNGFEFSNLDQIAAALSADILKTDVSSSTIRLELPKENLAALAEQPFVQFVEPIDEKGYPENYKARNTHRVGSLTKSFTGLSKELDGAGMHVMMQDDGFIGPHLDYSGRVVHYITTNRGDHGDHVAGTIMGAGNIDPLAKGMAPSSTLYVYGAAGDGYPGYDSITSHYTKHDIKITSTSYSNGTNVGYSTFARRLDIQTEQMPALLHVFSAGNAGTSNGGWYNVTGGHKVAKNVLTVANLTHLDEVNSSSSRGPARDGRIKPEISAIGTSIWSTTDVNDYTRKTGTSMSCPGVSGTMAVLYQGYKEKHTSYPDAILMKAIACNTADDLGNPGPDFKFGYGRINARKAYSVIANNMHFSDNISNGATDTFTIAIPPTKKLGKIMLAWNDPRGAANAQIPLVNNLDLELIMPTGQKVLPYVLDISSVDSLDNPATTGVDNINNMEQIGILNFPAGNYKIVVKGTSIPQGPQKFHVVYYLEDEGVELEYPVGGESFVPGETEVIRWSAPENIGSFSLEYSLDSGKTWTNISNVNTAQSTRYHEWRVPQAFTSNAIVKVSAGQYSSASNVFTISSQPRGINITKICPDSMIMTWAGVSGASNYGIYTMGAKYMELVGTENASPYIFKGANYNPFKEMYFAVDAVTPNGTRSRRTTALLKVPQLLNCPLSADIELVKFEQGAETVIDCGTQNPTKSIEVSITNNESQTFSNVDLYLQLNGGAITKEVYTGVVSLGQTIKYKFSKQVTYQNGTNELKVWMDDPNDQNRFNDTLVGNVQVYSNPEIKPSCYAYDFENLSPCGIENDCAATTCALDDGWINGINGLEDDIDWRVDAAGTATQQTGPFVDHTLGNGLGKYVYLEASGGCSYQEAALISPCIDLTTAVSPKVSYWYNMYGANMGALRVDLYKNGVWTNDITPVVSGNKGTQWINNEIDLSAHKGSVIRIRFRGSTGAGIRSDLALDDIKFTDEVKAKISFTDKGNGLVEFKSETPGATYWDWLFSNGDTSRLENPVVQFDKLEGIKWANLLIASPCGGDTVEVEFMLEAESVAEFSALRDVEVYPTPADKQFTVKWNKKMEVSAVQLLDLTGKTILSFDQSTDQKEQTIDIRSLESGVYLVQLNYADGVLNKKVVIQ